jgi:hypothetical protein
VKLVEQPESPSLMGSEVAGRREWEAQRDALATVRRFNARLSVVLAQDCRCAHFKASLVGHQLRQLWNHGGLRLARKAA